MYQIWAALSRRSLKLVATLLVMALLPVRVSIRAAYGSYLYANRVGFFIG
jgi:hypothetical protein